MALITRKQLDTVQLRTQIVDVPEWATPDMKPGDVPQVMIRELMGNERDAYEASLITMRGSGKNTTQELHLQNARAKIAVMGLINADGTQMYKNNPVDIAALGKLPAKGLERVVDAIMLLSGITEDTQEGIEEAAANFPNGEINGFGTN